MRVIENATELALEPEEWDVTLKDGSLLQVLAHGYSVDGRYCVFKLLFRGSPNFEVASLRIPLSLLPEGFS